MSTKYLLVMLIMLLASACAPSAPSNPADRFGGTWSGTMSATHDPTLKADAVVTILMGCAANEVCGDAINTANGCRWEMTLPSHQVSQVRPLSMHLCGRFFSHVCTSKTQTT